MALTKSDKLIALDMLTPYAAWGVSEGGQSPLYGVPVVIDEKDYIVYVGPDWKRIYTVDTLPTYIKMKLGFIRCAAAHDEVGKKLELNPHTYVRTSTYPKEFKEIGYRAAVNTYFVMLPKSLLLEMRGGVEFR